MSIVETHGGPITHKALMKKSKWQLAAMYMELLRVREEELVALNKKVDEVLLGFGIVEERNGS